VPLGAIGMYPVASTTLNLVEPGAAAGVPGRSLPTQVWFPTGRHARGRAFPLVVFSQGYDLAASAYGGLIGDWSSAGYVVAAPTYPHTDPSDAADLDEYDIVNHPADLRFVITSVLGVAGQPGSVLTGLVDPSAVGVIGHSDGGDVSLAVAANTCCRDPRVKAAVILSGAELASFGGSYFAAAGVPLLAVQGDADTVNPPACSVQFYDAASAPKYYLDLLGAAHEPPYTEPGTAAQSVVATVTIDFLDAHLSGVRRAIPPMLAAGNVAGVSEIMNAAPAPPAPGGCTGAPGN